MTIHMDQSIKLINKNSSPRVMNDYFFILQIEEHSIIKILQNSVPLIFHLLYYFLRTMTFSTKYIKRTHTL